MKDLAFRRYESMLAEEEEHHNRPLSDAEMERVYCHAYYDTTDRIRSQVDYLRKEKRGN